MDWISTHDLVVLDPDVEYRSLENPSTPLSDPDEWLFDALGGGKSDSGIRVNRKSALCYPAVWQAVRLISNDIAATPLDIYRRVNGGKEKDRNHPAWRLVRREANEEMAASTFWTAMLVNMLLSGNGISAIERNNRGEPTALLPIMAEDVHMIRENGRLWYVVNVSDEGEAPEFIRLQPSQVFHLQVESFDGIQGLDPVSFGKDAIGLGIGMAKYQSKFFANNAEARVVLESDQPLKKETIEALRSQWNSMHQGLDNAHKTAVMTGGVKSKVLSATARESQLNEAREHEIRVVAQLFNLKPHKLGDRTRTSYSSLEEENKDHLFSTLNPIMVAIEDEGWRKLLSDRQKRAESHFLEFNRESFVRTDFDKKVDGISKLLAGNAAITQDEARGFLNMNPLGGKSSEIQSPVNNFGEPAEQQGEDNSERKIAAARRQVRDAIWRVTNKVAITARKAAKDPERFHTWMATFQAEPRDGLVSCIDDVFTLAGVTADPESVVGTMCTSIHATLSERSETAVDGNQLFQWVDDALDDWRESEPDRVVSEVF